MEGRVIRSERMHISRGENIHVEESSYSHFESSTNVQVTSRGHFEEKRTVEGQQTTTIASKTTDKKEKSSPRWWPFSKSSSQPQSQPPVIIKEITNDDDSGQTVDSPATDRPNIDFAEECLEAHNEFRKRHGVGPLTLNKEISKYSQEWAKKLASEGKMYHRTADRKYGENLFYKWSSESMRLTGREVVQAWYDEIKDHIFGIEPKSLASGHFTQVIWKSSREMGVAMEQGKNGAVIVVANYSPAGNMMGQFSSNVPPVA